MAPTAIQPDEAVPSATDESYVLPHEYVQPPDLNPFAPEYQRLDKQSHAIFVLLGNRHVHAPIPRDASLLLDIGCGFGNVSRWLAADNPQARVIGVDLAPVPLSGDLPKNLSFVQGNVLDLAEEQSLLKPNSADLVFSRLLVAGLRGGLWPAYVKAVTTLLKPGGYLNLVDLFMRGYECTDPSRPTETKRSVPLKPIDELREIGAEMNFDFECGRNLEQYMKDAGLVDIQVHEYPWPLGAWLGKDYPPAREYGFEGQASGLASSLSQLYKSKYSDEEVETRRQELEELLGNGQNQFILLYAVTGRKPE